MEPTSPHNQAHDEEIINILKSLGKLTDEYPPELLEARRANFITQIEKRKGASKDSASSREEFIQGLERLSSVREEYPKELLAARRAAFVAQLEQQVAVKEETISKDGKIGKTFSRLKSVASEYPPRLLSARRAAFRRQLALGGRISLLDMVHSSLQRLLHGTFRLPALPPVNSMRTSLVIAVLMVAAFVGSVLRVRQPLYAPAPTQGQAFQPVPILATSTHEIAQPICKPGYEPPLCLVKAFDKSQDLTYQGNGSARPAVAKDTMPGRSGIHKASYINDGMYGPGASWVSNSAYSWIKIDLGKPTAINTVTFGRDRLGKLNDGDPGQFVIAIALSDNIYADGNSSRDYVEYTRVYHSSRDNFDGIVSGAETIRADFEPVLARYIKIIFANSGTAVDEVEVFMTRASSVASDPTRKPREDEPTVPSTPVPSNTPRPADTATPVPTDTLLPTEPPTDIPTNTPRPTRTPLPEPTDTPRPTRTPIPEPTDTPRPTNTPEATDPPPTDTPEPLSTPVEQPFIPPLTETPFVLEGP